MVFRSVSETQDNPKQKRQKQQPQQPNAVAQLNMAAASSTRTAIDNFGNNKNNDDDYYYYNNNNRRPPQKPLHNSPLRLQELKWANNQFSPNHLRSGNFSSSSDIDVAAAAVKKPNKLLIRLNTNKGRVKEEGEVPKTWNLRPRNPPVILPSLTKPPPNPFSSNATKRGGGGGGGGGGSMAAATKKQKNKYPQKQEKKNNNNNNNHNNNKNKRKIPPAGMEMEMEIGLGLSIPLAKDEIEEDFFTLTRSKPPTRPKKRPKHIQKLLDYVFPGLWLNSITPESYKISDPRFKG